MQPRRPSAIASHRGLMPVAIQLIKHYQSAENLPHLFHTLMPELDAHTDGRLTSTLVPLLEKNPETSGCNYPAAISIDHMAESVACDFYQLAHCFHSAEKLMAPSDYREMGKKINKTLHTNHGMEFGLSLLFRTPSIPRFLHVPLLCISSGTRGILRLCDIPLPEFQVLWVEAIANPVWRPRHSLGRVTIHRLQLLRRSIQLRAASNHRRLVGHPSPDLR